MCPYLTLSALHVSDSLVHNQDRRVGAVYRNWYKPVRLAVARATASFQSDEVLLLSFCKVGSDEMRVGSIFLF